MIIDFHVHCFPDDLAVKAIPVLEKCSNISANTDGTVDSIKKSMKIAGIDKSVILSIASKPSQTEKINSWSSEIQSDEIVAFGSIHPDYVGWKEELKRIKQLGLKGIKFHPDYQSFFVDEPRMFPIYESAFELGLIIVFHAGVDIGLPAPCHCTPDRLIKLVDAFTGGDFVAAHMGGYLYQDDVERLLVGRDIYLDTSYSLGHMSDEQAKRMIQNHDYKKILFATDSPWKNQKEEVIKLKSLYLDSEVENAILSGNSIRLLAR